MTALFTTEAYPEDDLPLGIFPEAYPESCYHALRQYGIPCTRLNAELFYEMGQIQRNCLEGCSTVELREMDLWDQLSGMSLWDEPIWKVDDRLLAPEERQDNLNRQARFEHLETFLKQVYCWCQNGVAPEIVPHCNGRGQSNWRFRRLTWTEEGIQPLDSMSRTLPASPTQVLNAAWNYLFWCRRRWLKAHPGKVWLAEHCLHLIRHAFKALLIKFAVPQSDWPDIEEEPKPSWPSKLEDKIAELEDRERRALERLHQLQENSFLTAYKLRRALTFLDELADEIDSAQRRLDEAFIKLARHNGYDEGYWGAPLEQCHLSQLDLLELREEMKLIIDEEEQLSPNEPSFQPPADLYNIHFTPAA